MRVRSLLVVLLLAAIAAFVTLNWSVYMAPAPLNLGWTTIEAPPGLVALGLLALCVVVFALYLLVWQSSFLLEARRQAKELQAQRSLAEQAETSRFMQLQALMQTELSGLNQRIAESQEALHTEIRENANSIAAAIGELDDRLQRRPEGNAPG